MRLLAKRHIRRPLNRVAEFLTERRTMRLVAANRRLPGPPACQPVWPLPRCTSSPPDSELVAQFARYDEWQYSYEFEGGLRFMERHAAPLPVGHRDGDVRRRTGHGRRPLQRFAHFMPWLLQATGGSLKGLRVLDMACNSGFWSIQCALLGAEEVIGFDAQPKLVEEAQLIRSVVGVGNVDFRVLDFWGVDVAKLGGPFDVVLNLGLMYYLPKPIEALELTKMVARKYILLDTGVYVSKAPVVLLDWMEPQGASMAVRRGVVMRPSKRSIELMLRHVGLTDFIEIPLRSLDMPPDYLTGRRVSWLIKAG